ncbi:MAG TPA: phosphate signaling complex protein PhoU [Pirellulales bacterium]|jgi:phosphate transport system protein|nr:phosphate signaling complex protein PhoU [Pirellulales bacterium]
MAEHLHRQLHELKQEIVYVGSLVEEALDKALRALSSRNELLAREVVEADEEINRMEVAVEEDCLRILALYQPVAMDLRFVVAVLKINNDLERIGDLAKNIAKRVIYLSRAREVGVPSDFREMARIAQHMVKQSLDALVTSNSNLARQVRGDDDKVDAIRDRISETMSARIQEHPEQIEVLMKLFSVARHLERLADMATHIAEEVIYMVDGAIVRHRAGA